MKGPIVFESSNQAFHEVLERVMVTQPLQRLEAIQISYPEDLKVSQADQDAIAKQIRRRVQARMDAKLAAAFGLGLFKCSADPQPLLPIFREMESERP